MKTTLLVVSVAAAALVMWFVTSQRRNILPAIAGLVVVPSIIVAYFVARGAWSNLFYGVVRFNALIESVSPHNDLVLKRIAYVPTLLIILWIAKRTQPSSDDPSVRWRFFFALTTAFFIITLFSFWVLISSRDFLAILPILAIFLVAALDRLDIRLPLYVAMCFVFVG
jgi:hypothetical protein